MQNEHGEIIIFQAEDGQSSLKVHLEEESVWLSQKQMADLFAKDVRTVNEHIKNVYAEGELKPGKTIRNFRIVQKEGEREVARQVDHYSLDVIISVGYRVKSQRGTQFRIWATSVLRDHLIKGYTVNERRLAEKGLSEMEQAIALLTRTLESHESLSDEGRAVLDVINRYARSWSLLLKYDEDRLELPKSRHPTKQPLDYDRAAKSIKALKNDLLERGEATGLFAVSNGVKVSGVFSATSTRPSVVRNSIPAWKKRRPTSCILLSRIIPSATAISGSALSSSWFSSRRTICWNNPALMTTGW